MLPSLCPVCSRSRSVSVHVQWVGTYSEVIMLVVAVNNGK